MALFNECMPRCAQKVFDTADIVRDGDLSTIDGGDMVWNIYGVQHTRKALPSEKTGRNMNRRSGVRALGLYVLALCFSCCQTAGQRGSDASRLLLRVVNRHFTVGNRIPSDFLKVFSDGTVECRAVKFGEHDANAVKMTHLSRNELAKVISALDDSGFRHLSNDYKLQRFVIDSWMEWDITIEQPSHRQNVTLAFAGGSGQTALPDALGRLGCLILELRRTAYGDDTNYYTPACTVR